ncbi:MAG TPA: hypothetical protein VKA34_01875 [Balneolales bacterium]|nr:hypothetical protein [Balneolales bacterium]
MMIEIVYILIYRFIPDKKEVILFANMQMFRVIHSSVHIRDSDSTKRKQRGKNNNYWNQFESFFGRQ